MGVPGRLVGFGLVLAAAWGVGYAVGAATRPLDDPAFPAAVMDGQESAVSGSSADRQMEGLR